jgi:glycerophosphoryl diester phosphodiesterase
MPNDAYCLRDGHRTYFKWHRARRQASDPVFTGQRILEGLTLGASVEVDLVHHGSGGFAVLHDAVLGRESTGEGKVAETSAAVLRTLRIRDNDGHPSPHPVMLLEDLCALLARGGFSPEGLLQLDLKEDLVELGAGDIAAFKRAVRPVASTMILSAGDASAVAALADGVPGLRIGYDPCHQGSMERLTASRDFKGFVDGALSASPRAELIYLAYPLVLFAADNGFDIVAAFHEAGKRIDAYTIKSVDAASRPIVERLLAARVDQITTDDPVGLAAMIAQSETEPLD